MARAIFTLASIWLVWTAAAGGQAVADDRSQQTCANRPVAAADGTPAGLDDCQVEKLLRRADLQKALRSCVERAQAAKLRVYGGFDFSFDLSPGGGVAAIEVSKSAFDRTGLPGCLKRTIMKRLGRGRPSEGEPGKAARISGKLTVREASAPDFSLSLSGALVARPKPPRKLAGLFNACPGGLTASCRLGRGRLVLRLGNALRKNGPRTCSREGVSADTHKLLDRLDACEDPLRENRDWKRSEWKKERIKARDCIMDFLDDANLEVRVAAAEHISRGRYWRGRRALTALIRRMLAAADCQADDCPLVAPQAEAQGYALVRLILAQIKLRRFVTDEVLDALARHKSAGVRLRVVRDILPLWRHDLPDAAGILLHDSDMQVRLITANLACQREDRRGRAVFLTALADGDPVVRAGAAIYAANCARRARLKVIEAVEHEKLPAPALLMLQALPSAPEELVEKRAVNALLDGCPVIRYLAVRLLVRLRSPPLKKISAVLPREPNQLLRNRLRVLLSGSGSPLGESVQLWLQPTAGRAITGP